MTRVTINRKPIILGAYLDDNANLAPTLKGTTFWTNNETRFLPIVNLFNFNTNGELRLADTKSVGNDIATYNSKSYPYNYAQSLVRNNRIDVSAGDITVGSIRCFLNFTDSAITIKTRTDIPKTYQPVKNDQLDHMHGRMFVISFQSFNVPSVIKEMTGLGNYFDNLRAEKLAAGQKDSVAFQMLDYLATITKDLKPPPVGTPISNSIKLVMIHEFTPNDFFVNGKPVTTIDDAESGLMITRANTVLSLPSHLRLSDTIANNQEIVNTFREHGVTCFIVDNAGEVGDRFFNFAGSVRAINKVKDPNMMSGLYIIATDSNKALSKDEFIPISELDNNQFIFKSREEAITGSDVRVKLEREFELQKLNLQAALATDKHEIEIAARNAEMKHKAELAAMDVANKQLQANHESIVRDLELKHNEKLRELKQTEEARKVDFQQDKINLDLIGMRQKSRYEEEKFNRDSTIETMKTIGAIAGLAAGGYMLIKQLSK